MPRPAPERLALLRALLAAEGVIGRAPAADAPPARNADGSAPLSSGQLRLWYLDRLDPGTSVYNDCIVSRLRGHALDVAALERALATLVERHEALRTSFRTLAGEPRQHVAPRATLPLRTIDLRDVPAPERLDAADDVLRSCARIPFTLAEAPLGRVTLVRLDDLDHELALTLHHAVSDAVSYGVLHRELGVLYEAARARREHGLRPPAAQPADFAAFERARAATAAAEAQLEHWCRELAGLADAPPLARPGAGRLALLPGLPGPREGALEHLELPAPSLWSLRDFCRGHECTSGQALLAAWFALLFALSERTDLVVGMPASQRTRAELDALVGFLVQTVLVRVDLSGDPSFLELVRRVAAKSLAAVAHSDVPFERVVQALRARHPSGAAPEIEVWFTHMRDLVTPLVIDGVAHPYRWLDTGHARFDLALILDETSDALTGFLEYDTALFRPEEAALLVERYTTLLHRALERPETELSALIAGLDDARAAATRPSRQRGRLIELRRPRRASGD